MKLFTLILQSATQRLTMEKIKSFVGEDASGSFGILAEHTHLIATLEIGLARFTDVSNQKHFLAVPGAVVLFKDNQLVINTRHFLVGDDYFDISSRLQQELLLDQQALEESHKSIENMEQAMMKRLLKTQHGGEV